MVRAPLTRPARGFPVLLALAALVAGCAGEAQEGVRPAAVDEAAPFAPPTAPPDNRTGGFAAFNETNVTEGGAHSHDLWAGRERVEIARQRVGMAADGTTGAAGLLRAPEGVEHLVFEGTGTVTVEVSKPERRACEGTIIVNGDAECTPGVPDPAPPAALRVEVQHAASAGNDWLAVGEARWGEPLLVAVPDATWTDMPHASASLWAFRFRSPAAQDQWLTFEAAVTIERAGGEVPEWPPHPDFYAESHERVVMDGPARGQEAPGTAWSYEGATPTRLVSSGTRTLYVFVNVTKLDGAVKPTHWALQFHNASGRYWNLTEWVESGTTGDRTQLAWVLAVDENGMDSPYAPQSRWEIALRGIVANCLDGCAAYTVAYDARIVASDAEASSYSVVQKWLPR